MFLFLAFACLHVGISGLHQHDRSKSSGELNEGSNRWNKKTMGHSYGIGNGASGPVRGTGFGVKSLLNETQRITNTEYSSRFLPKYMYTKEWFSCLLSYFFLPFVLSL